MTAGRISLRSDAPVGLTVAPLDDSSSISLGDGLLHLVTENQLFGQRIRQTRRRQKQKTDAELVIRDLSELKPGAPVVHLDHGIGRYMGLETLDAGGQVNEFLVLEYAGNAKLYVPVSSLHLVSRYGGAEGGAPLSKLGTDKWAQAKRKAAEKIRDTAAELLDIYARREARKGYAFSGPDEEYERFAAGFPFEETPTSSLPLMPLLRICARPAPWTAWCVVTWASVKPKWPCAPPFWRYRAASRWRCWCPPPAGAAALSEFCRPLCRVAGKSRRAVTLQIRKRNPAGAGADAGR